MTTLHSFKQCTLTRHALVTAQQKGFSLTTIRRVFSSPSEYYPSGSHPGQYRMTGHGLCLVGKPDGDTFVVITMYADRIITPLRPDQESSGVVINRVK